MESSAAGAGVPEKPTWQAIQLAGYLEAHAQKIYAASWQQDLRAAHALAKRLQKGEVADGCNIRGLYRRHWSGLSNRYDVVAGLEVLEQLGWVQLTKESTGGAPREVVRIHPDLRR